MHRVWNIYGVNMQRQKDAKLFMPKSLSVMCLKSLLCYLSLAGQLILLLVTLSYSKRMFSWGGTHLVYNYLFLRHRVVAEGVRRLSEKVMCENTAHWLCVFLSCVFFLHIFTLQLHSLFSYFSLFFFGPPLRVEIWCTQM